MISQSKQNHLAGYGCEDVDLRGFVSLMDMYENNYLRLRRLIPDVTKLPDYVVSQLAGCLTLHMDVLERTKFTTTLRMPGDEYALTEADEIERRAGRGIDLILDGGPCGMDLTTVVVLTGDVPEVVRRGAGDIVAFE